MLFRIDQLFLLLLCSLIHFDVTAKKYLVKTNNSKTAEAHPRAHDDYRITIDDSTITQENFHCVKEGLILKGKINRTVQQINHAVCTSDYQSRGEIRLRRNNKLTTLPVFGHEFYISFELFLDKRQKRGKKKVGIFTLVDKSKCPNLKARNRKKCRLLSIYLVPRKQTLKFKKLLEQTDEYEEEIHTYQKKKMEKYYNEWIQVTLEQFPKRNGKLLFQIKYDGMIGDQWEIEAPAKHENVIVYASEPWYQLAKGKIRNLVISAFEKEHEAEDDDSYDSYEDRPILDWK